VDPRGESGDLWSSDEDIDMAAMVLISPSGPGGDHFSCLASLLSPKAGVPAGVPLGSSSNTSSAGGSMNGGGSSTVADYMNCFSNLGDITPFDTAPGLSVPQC